MKMTDEEINQLRILLEKSFETLDSKNAYEKYAKQLNTAYNCLNYKEICEKLTE